jgi:hypothetical protein
MVKPERVDSAETTRHRNRIRQRGTAPSGHWPARVVWGRDGMVGGGRHCHLAVFLRPDPLCLRVAVAMRPADRKRLFDGSQCRGVKIKPYPGAMFTKMVR